MGTLIEGIKEIFSTSQTTATHIPTCQSDGTPTGHISAANLASVLGGMPEAATALFSNTSILRISPGTATGVIEKGLKQGILFCAINGPSYNPSIFIMGRTSLAATLYEGTVQSSNLSVDGTTGNVNVTKGSTSSFYYRFLALEG